MNQPFSATKIADDIYWVGAIDYNVRDFHGYSTDSGTTYNAYLILADKVTLVDTVKREFKGELMSRIASVIDPSKIDYIISHHAELDHSGALMDVISAVNPEKVFTSSKGEEALKAHFHTDYDFTVVKDTEELSLGNMTLQFLETRMLHWPDSMISYLKETNMVFSQDGFGMHLASAERFDDELPKELLFDEAEKYFANILTPFSPQVKKLLKRVTELELKIDMILPDHGPIWRSSISDIVTNWGNWAEQKPTMSAVVFYDTMWGSTDKMARAIAEGLTQGGVKPFLHAIGASDRSKIATDVLRSGAVIIGSPTVNNQVFPAVMDVITYLKGLRFKNLIGAAFGSYGWSGEATKRIEAEFEAMKIELAAEAVKSKYVPTQEVLLSCHKLGMEVALKLKEQVEGN